MKKLLTTLVAFVALLFGALAFVAPITSAAAEPCSAENPGTAEEPCGWPPCTAENPGSAEDPCTPVEPEPTDPPCVTSAAVTEGGAESRVLLAAAEVRASSQTARADRLQRIADRRAETIKRLRAKIRELR